MLKDPKPPMFPKETSLTTHPEASTKMNGINWTLSIRLFSIISRTLVGGGESYSSAEMQLEYSTAPRNQMIAIVRGQR